MYDKICQYLFHTWRVVLAALYLDTVDHACQIKNTLKILVKIKLTTTSMLMLKQCQTAPLSLYSIDTFCECCTYCFKTFYILFSVFALFEKVQTKQTKDMQPCYYGLC